MNNFPLFDQNLNLLKSIPLILPYISKKPENTDLSASARHYRAPALEIPEGLLWFWIGGHSQYDQFLK